MVRKMQKTLFKEIFREIKGSLNRYLAILAIVALGVTFYAGFNSLGPDMSSSATNYFSQTNFRDYRLLSSIGFDDDDVKAVHAVSGVKAVQPIYSMDAMQTYEEETNVAHLISIPGGNDNINSLTVVDGRLPRSSDECVVDKQKIGKPPKIGDTIALSSGSNDNISDSVSATELKVVGIVETPEYLTKDRGTSKIGTGKVSGLIFIPQQDFKIPVYTELLITASDVNGLDVFSKAYSDKTSALETGLNNVSDTRTKVRHDELVSDANTQLAQQQSNYDSQKAQADQSIADAQAKIDDSQNKLNAAQTQLNDAKDKANQQFSSTQVQLDAAAKQISDNTAEYNQNLEAYNQSLAYAQPKIAQAQQGINTLSSNISSLQSQLSKLENELAAGTTNGSLTPAQSVGLNEQIAGLKGKINNLTQQLTSAQYSLAAQKKQLSDAKSQLDSAKQALDSGTAQLSSQKASFATAQKQAQDQFATKQQQINDQQKSIDSARRDLESQKANSDQKLNDAAQQISDAKQKISDIATPKWVVQTRDDNTGYASFKGMVDRSNGMSSILPVIFFAIAALVCLTTMTRMVEEECTQIGTLKALGYSNGAIAFKYLFYAGSASLLGSLLGMAVGFTLLPNVMMKAYMILYTMADVNVAFHPSIAITAIGIALTVIIAATLFTCFNELRSVPATLMRPPAPKAGKRIVFERIGFLWKHLSFSKKVTARNLFRYKKRFWMTVLGVACCCAMLLSGLGLRDSISTQVSKKEFGEILKFGMNLQLKSNITADQIIDITNTLKTTSGVASNMESTSKSITVGNGAKSDTCTLMIPQQPDEFSKYFVLRTAPTRTSKTGDPIALSDNGVVITQQLAQDLNLKKGDTLTIQDDDTHSHSFHIDGIAENYLMNYVFMTPNGYAKVYGANIDVNQVLVDLSASASHDKIFSSIMTHDGISAVTFMSDNEQTFHDMLKSLNYIIWMIILSAVLLAFVVLYTLTTINIGERFREIATIKVLGFYDREVSAYITRESYILTLIGIVIGLVGGVILHNRILGGIEVGGVMFVKSILLRSFLISAVLTFLFTWIVNRITMGSLKKIDMVEALKGNE